MTNPYNSPELVNKYLSAEKPLSVSEIGVLSKILTINMTICEIGFGSGELLQQLLDNGYTKLCGIDSSAPFVTHAKNRFGEKVEILNHDLLQDNVTGRTFDAVIACHFVTAIQNAAHRNHAIEKTCKMIKSRGMLLTKSFLSKVDKTVHSVQCGVALDIWIPDNDNFCRRIIEQGFSFLESTIIDKDGFPEILNVFQKDYNQVFQTACIT